MPSALTRRLAKLATAGALVLASPCALALVAAIDTFTIVKNGGLLYQDTFDDNVAPPAAPGEFATYLFPTGAITESGGKAFFNAASGVLAPNAAGAVASVTRVTFSTNIVPSESTGLKSDQTFSVRAAYSLLDNTVVGDNYGLRLTDRNALGTVGAGTSGDDVLELRVSHLGSGSRQIEFRRQDFLGGLVQPIASFTLTPTFFAAYDSVELQLSKGDINSNAISASATFIPAAGPSITVGFLTTGDAFRGENWTRAELFASQAPIPEPGTYAMMLAGLALVGWQLRRATRKRPHAALR